MASKIIHLANINNAVMTSGMKEGGSMSNIPGITSKVNPFVLNVVARHSVTLSSHGLRDMASDEGGYEEKDEIIVKIFKDNIDQTTKRNAEILKSVKNKGYYAEWPSELQTIIMRKAEKEILSNQPNTTLAPAACFIDEATNKNAAFGNAQLPFTESEWYFAIEAGFYFWSPEKYCEDNIVDFRMNLKYAIPYIWWNLMFIHTLNELPKRNNIVQRTEEFAKLTEENRKLKETVYSMEQAIESNHSRAEREKAEAIEQARRDAQRETLSQMSKDRARLEHDIKDRDMIIADLTRQLSALSSQGASDEAAKAIQQEMSPTKPVPEDSDDQLEISLPSKGVLFVSAQEAMLKKVKSLHPDWSFLSSKTIDTIDPSIRLVIIHTEFIGHSLQEKVRAQCPDGADILFVSKTNSACLEREILERYRNIKTQVA